MPRPIATPQQVRKVAEVAAQLRAWLWSAAGASAGHAEFSRAVSTYNALMLALRMLPHGPRMVSELEAQPPRRSPDAVPGDQPSSGYSLDELALLDSPVLASDGWVCPVDLLSHVQNIRRPGETDQDVLRGMLARVRGSELKAAAELQKYKTRLSRLKKARQAAVTSTPKKMPPEGG